MPSPRPTRPSPFTGSIALGAAVALLLPLVGCADSGEDADAKADPIGLGARSPSQNIEELQAPQLYMMARDAAQAGEDEKAVELFRRVAEMEPEIADVHFSLGTLLVPMASAVMLGSSTIDYEVLDEALRHLQKALELDPANASYHYWTGRALDVRGREDEALERLAKAVELDPEHAKAHKRMGLVYVERGDVAQAEAAFLRARELSPNDSGLHYQLGNLALDGDPTGARDYYRAAIELNPKSATAYHGLSQALAQLGEAEEAEEARATAERLQGHKDTLQRLEQLADAQPANVDAQFEAAAANFALHKYERAETLLTRVVQLQPDHADAHYYFGLLRMEDEDWTMAMNHLEESLYFAPDQIGPRVELIRVYGMLENAQRIEELALELETIMERSGVGADARNAVAEVFLDIGRRDKAVEYLRAVVTEDAGNEVATILLERAERGQ